MKGQLGLCRRSYVLVTHVSNRRFCSQAVLCGEYHLQQMSQPQPVIPPTLGSYRKLPHFSRVYFVQHQACRHLPPRRFLRCKGYEAVINLVYQSPKVLSK